MIQDEVSIRHATREDAQALAEVHVRSWQWAYRGLLPADYLAGLSATLDRRIAWWRRELLNLPPDDRFWLAERAGYLAGFAQTTGTCRDSDVFPNTAELPMIYLAPEETGKGIGRVLFAHAIEDLRQRGYAQAILWVLGTNERARHFYEAAGWTPDGGLKSEERFGGVVLHEVRYHLLF